MDIDYKKIADRAADYAGGNNMCLDYSEKSIEDVEYILGIYYDHLDEYGGEEGADTLWNIAVHFGIYLGETMLKTRLKDKEFQWCIEDGIPFIKNSSNFEISPVTKAHKRILNGPEDNVKSFCDVAFSIVNGNFPIKGVHRAVSVHLPSGEKLDNTLLRDIRPFIMSIEEGKEDFLILESHNGFLQFYGINNQFVAEIRVNLPDEDFRTFSIINKEKGHLTGRIPLTTPYGQFTPTEREIVSLELIEAVVQKYYELMDTDDLLNEIPYIETTLETKQYMGR